MKRIVLFLMVVVSVQKSEAILSRDSLYIKGVVRPEDGTYPFNTLKRVSLSVLKNDTVIQRTYSDYNGCFLLTCAKKDLNSNLQILAEARTSQPVITYDSICPYIVFQTSSGYFDKYTMLADTMAKMDEIQLEIKMSAPLKLVSNCMRFNVKGRCAPDGLCIDKHPDTMCICVANSVNRLYDRALLPTMVIRSYYTEQADSARIQAEQMARMFEKHYAIKRDIIKIELYRTSENTGPEMGQNVDCNYILVSIMVIGRASEKDH